MKKFLLFLLLSLYMFYAFSQSHTHLEKYYQTEFAKILIENKLSSIATLEYVLEDNTRIDILTDDYAIEADFASKWAESIGQSLFYGLMTNKKPGVLLILEDLNKDEKYLIRLKDVAKEYNITIWIISSELNWKLVEND